jgi:hypothetical protein
MPPVIRRILQLSAEERRIVAEAVALTPVAATLIRTLGLERAARLLARGGRLSPPHIDSQGIAALVNASVSRVGGQCLVQALVLHGVLARRGLESTIFVGTATIDDCFRAHAWVSTGPSTSLPSTSLRAGQPYRAIWQFPRGRAAA